MATKIRTVEYYYVTVEAQPGGGYQLLRQLAHERVNLLAFSAIPLGPGHTQLALFPESIELLAAAAEKLSLVLTGPQHALLVQGDDELGALVGIHERLFEAGVNVFASHGVTDDRGGFGYLIHVRPDELEAGASALGVAGG